MISNIIKKRIISGKNSDEISKQERYIIAARKLWARGNFFSAISLLNEHELPFTVLDAVPVSSFVEVLERMRIDDGLADCFKTKIDELTRVVNDVVNNEGDLRSTRKEVEHALETKEQYTRDQVTSLTSLLDKIDTQFRYGKMMDFVVKGELYSAKKVAKIIEDDSIFSARHLTGGQMRYVVDILNLKLNEEVEDGVEDYVIFESVVDRLGGLLKSYCGSILDIFSSKKGPNLYTKSGKLRGPGVTRNNKVPTYFDSSDAWFSGERLSYLIGRGFNYDLIVRPGYIPTVTSQKVEFNFFKRGNDPDYLEQFLEIDD